MYCIRTCICIFRLSLRHNNWQDEMTKLVFDSESLSVDEKKTRTINAHDTDHDISNKEYVVISFYARVPFFYYFKFPPRDIHMDGPSSGAKAEYSTIWWKSPLYPPKVQNPNPHPPPPRSSLDDHTLLTAVVRFIHFYQTFWSALPTSPGQHLRILRAGRLDSPS